MCTRLSTGKVSIKVEGTAAVLCYTDGIGVPLPSTFIDTFPIESLGPDSRVTRHSPSIRYQANRPRALPAAFRRIFHRKARGSVSRKRSSGRENGPIVLGRFPKVPRLSNFELAGVLGGRPVAYRG